MDRTDDHQEVTRAPTREDIVKLARSLNKAGARYVIVGGMAIIELGLRRTTMDIDLLVDDDEGNVQKICDVLAVELEDKAALEVEPGDIKQYVVVRINDEITVDLLGSACGVNYTQARTDIRAVDIEGVSVPFASPELLLKMKDTYREKDALDRAFLKRLIGLSPYADKR